MVSIDKNEIKTRPNEKFTPGFLLFDFAFEWFVTIWDWCLCRRFKLEDSTWGFSKNEENICTILPLLILSQTVSLYYWYFSINSCFIGCACARASIFTFPSILIRFQCKQKAKRWRKKNDNQRPQQNNHSRPMIGKKNYYQRNNWPIPSKLHTINELLFFFVMKKKRDICYVYIHSIARSTLPRRIVCQWFGFDLEVFLITLNCYDFVQFWIWSCISNYVNSRFW